MISSLLRSREKRIYVESMAFTGTSSTLDGSKEQQETTNNATAELQQ